MGSARTVYALRIDGKLAMVGDAWMIAEAMGVTKDTVQTYSTRRLTRSDGFSVAVAGPDDNLPDPSLIRAAAAAARARRGVRHDSELAAAMRRRHDMLLGLDCNREWEL